MFHHVNLDELIAGDGGTITLKGQSHQVLPIGTAAYKRYLDAQSADPVTKYGIIFEIACQQVPSLSQEQRDALTPKQAGSIVALSLQTAEQVEASVPNASGPGEHASPA
jgi:hypothetical protein